MKLISYILDGHASYGAQVDTGIIDLKRRTGLPDLKSLLAAGPGNVTDVLTDRSDASIADVQLLPPIPNPSKIFGLGMNTYSHLREVETVGVQKPVRPELLPRFADCLVASGQPLEKPLLENFFDFEGEIAVIIGKPCRNVTPDEAGSYIGGYSIFNDASCREYQLTSRLMTAGKSGYRTGGFGPCIVTPDAIDMNTAELTTRVDGEVRQTMDLDDLVFSFGEIISFISEITWLQPGDVLATGSASGPGLFSTDEAKKRLQPGSTVEVEVTGIGTLVNTVQEQVLPL